MGQNNSRQPPQEVVRRPPPRPKAPPSARPLSELGPRGPSYHNPENKVLPSVLPENKLRPVSQELSKYHPEYKDIFNYDDDIEEKQPFDDCNEIDLDKENYIDSGMNNTMPRDMTKQLPVSMNGTIPSQNGHVPNAVVPSRPITIDNSQTNPVNIQRNVKGHRRQKSATSSLYSRENTILEDPEETRLENRGKLDPLAQSCPHVSIPVKSSFDMDYSYNLTYAQLAEHRRNKTLSDLEKRTGKRVDDLSADLADNEIGPSLSRQSSVKSARSTKSTGSLDLLSKKKKRAPPPPTQKPPSPPNEQSQPSSSRDRISKSYARSISEPNAEQSRTRTLPTSYSVDYEPKPDYDLDTPSSSPVRDNVLRTSSSASSLERRISPPAPPAPPPPPNVTNNHTNYSHVESGASNVKQTSGILRQHSLNDHSAKPSILRHHSMNVPSSSVNKSPENETVPWLLQIKKAAELRNTRRQLSETSDTPRPPQEKLNDEFEPTLVFSSTNNKNIVNDITVPDSNIQKQDGSKEKVPPPVPEKKTSVTSLERKNSTTSSSSATSSLQSSQNGDPLRRLNSLLQHDIKIAAQAKATKIVKHTTPVKEKPKDPAEVFREQLAKAAAEREGRMKSTPSIDDQLGVGRQFSDYKVTDAKEPEKDGNEILKTDSVTVKKVQSFKNDKDKNKEKEAEKSKPKEVITIEKEEFPRPKFIKKSQKDKTPSGAVTKHSRQRLPESDDEEINENDKKSTSFSNDWTPEDDLDSDDDISDRETVTLRKSNSEGFKSTIVPNKMDDLKKGKSKGKKYAKKNADADEKRKYDSIKRFKKSVHKSVQNAFGSISKASGKILKNKKPKDIEQVDNNGNNWKFSHSSSEPIFSEQVGRAYKYMVPNGYEDHASDESSDDERGQGQNSKVVFQNGDLQNGDIENSDDDDSESDGENEEEKYHMMKRAGVAYVSEKGQIVVLPEFETVRVNEEGKRVDDFEGRAPKIVQKKKKFAYDATVRKKERQAMEEVISETVKEKEDRMEAERKKQLQTETEFKKLRELEARDRLQKLEAQAQLQQQFFQQQQQIGVLNAPPLPPPSGFQDPYPANYSLLGSSGLPQTNMPNNMGLPFTTQPAFNGPLYNAGVPGVSYDLAEYMRILGMQGPNPVAAQYAYMLNSLNWTPQSYGMKGSGNIIDMMNQDQRKFYPGVSSHPQDSTKSRIYEVPTTEPKSPGTSIGVKPQHVTKLSVANSSIPDSNNGAFSKDSRSSVHSRQRTSTLDNSDDSDISNGLSPQRTEASLVARIKVGDFREVQMDSSDGHYTVNEPNSPTSLSRIYGPTGFRSVSGQPDLNSLTGSENSAER